MTSNSQLGTYDAEELACDGTGYTSAWTNPTDNLCGEDFPWIAFTSDSEQAVLDALDAYFGAFPGEQSAFSEGDNLVEGTISDSYYTNYVDIGIYDINTNSYDDWFEMECLEFDPTASYEQWDIAC